MWMFEDPHTMVSFGMGVSHTPHLLHPNTHAHAPGFPPHITHHTEREGGNTTTHHPVSTITTTITTTTTTTITNNYN